MTLLRSILMILIITVVCQVSLAQDGSVASTKWVKKTWDSTNIYQQYGTMEVYIANHTSGDTLIYFFGASKADSATSAMFRLLPSDYREMDIKRAGANWKAVFRKAAKDSVYTTFEKYPSPTF
jgi:hypothetical protein